MEKRSLSTRFQSFATHASGWVGNKWAFTAAILCVLIWVVTGPHFKYSDTWQLLINTATTIITFLMVFLIQNTQNRDAKAIHLKLDEIIRATRQASNQMINIEKLSDEELQALAGQFERISAEYEARKKGKKLVSGLQP